MSPDPRRCSWEVSQSNLVYGDTHQPWTLSERAYLPFKMPMTFRNKHCLEVFLTCQAGVFSSQSAGKGSSPPPSVGVQPSLDIEGRVLMTGRPVADAREWTRWEKLH